MYSAGFFRPRPPVVSVWNSGDTCRPAGGNRNGDGKGRIPGNGNPAEYFRAAADYSAVHTASAHGRSGLPVGVRRVSSTKRSTRGTL